MHVSVNVLVTLGGYYGYHFTVAHISVKCQMSNDYKYDVYAYYMDYDHTAVFLTNTLYAGSYLTGRRYSSLVQHPPNG